MQLKPDLPTPDRKRFDQEGLLYMSEQADAEGRANQYEPHSWLHLMV